ncbi:PepSY domain-containing protein [Roseivirga misakiensis]|uniref:NADPH--hemoprotein reductase n=1 Tax=Roseivirga misakiensis TaxID=1563681 RepID=A0A1E5SY89_9BACT|nr:PepSY domain-containing protein [Roseivirga misakiensis]OEK04007.1 hypothetical protein BFP71_10950 [Roseivirga misakiensis]
MSSSLWRAAHLWLAIISSVFLLIASVTGAILSFEPIYQKAHNYHIDNADDLSISDVIDNISSVQGEVLNITRDKNGFVAVQSITSDTPFYVNPFSGEKIGDVIRTPEIFEFCRTLHRSLLLGQTGRFLIGLTSVVLLFIALSGFFLILKKQGGLSQYFSKVVKNDFYKDYHTRLSRWLILSVIVLGISGTYLFLERFNVVLVPTLDHQVNETALTDGPAEPIATFTTFNTILLGDLREINFPFADFPDEYYELKLRDKELLVNQFNGEVLSEVSYPIVQLIYQISFNLHTGEGTTIWAAILGLTGIGTLFFIYSGFKIFLKRDRSKIVNPFSKDDCSMVILVGSEQGSTMRFAKALQAGLLKSKAKVYLTSLNNYEAYQSIEHLFILTSTYGVGEAPASADKFFQKLADKRQPRSYGYSVLGFGSKAYPDFCQYAIEVDLKMQQVAEAKPLLPLYKVNEESKPEFMTWLGAIGQVLHQKITINDKDLAAAKKKQLSFKVSQKQDSQNNADQTFYLELKTSKKTLKDYRSGDLLEITPPDETRERLYSMSVDHEKSTIGLSIRKHEAGICSTFLGDQISGNKLYGRLKSNPEFHFPKEAPGVILIANGTGIAPYLGMLAESSLSQHVSLFWGGQNKASYQLYESRINEALANGKLNRVYTAFSRENGTKEYVQDAIAKELDNITTALNQGYVVMICGGLNMQKAVENKLDAHLKSSSGISVETLKTRNQIKADCY